MSNRFPKKIQDKANELLALYERGLVKARKSHKCKYLVIEVSLRYRLLNKGSKWTLLSHEQYNREVLRWP